MFGVVLVILTVLSMCAAWILAKQAREDRAEQALRADAEATDPALSDADESSEDTDTTPRRSIRTSEGFAWGAAIVAIVAWVGLARFGYLAMFPLGSSMYGMENQTMSWNARAQLMGFPGIGVAAGAVVVLLVLAIGGTVLAIRRFRVRSHTH